MAKRAILATKILKIFPRSTDPLDGCATDTRVINWCTFRNSLCKRPYEFFFLTPDTSSPCPGHKVNGIIVLIGLAQRIMPCKEYRLSYGAH